MSKNTYLLKSKETVTVRNLSRDDVLLSHEFFQSIPKSKRKYFRSDVTNIKHLEERCLEAENGKVIRRIALMSGAFCADAASGLVSCDKQRETVTNVMVRNLFIKFLFY
jgi:hypothetical protein